ncbi:hypothetical protein D3C81_881390 [compost metagenome]
MDLAPHRERPQPAGISRNIGAVNADDREDFLDVLIYFLDQIRFKPRVVGLRHEDAVVLQRFVNSLIEPPLE